MRQRLATAIVTAVAALSIAACSNDDPAPSQKLPSSQDSPSAATTATTTEPKSGGFYDGRTRRWSYPASAAPPAPKPSGPPPTELTTETLRPGKGAPVQRGDKVVVNHIGLHYDGSQHDTTYGGGAVPIEIVVGNGVFIKGFERGVLGMRVGERRMVTVPPRLAYGSRGYAVKSMSSHIAPGETLIYVIDLEAIVER